MNTYYDTLGVKPDASQLEIKKAYFKLIRQYSPETDPEQFQKIREAYEYLKNAENTPKGPAFPPFSDPFAQKMAEQIAQFSREGNSKMYRDTCEQAWKLFPEDIQFLYHLVIAQRACGNTGKAVKNAEKLVEKEPENKWFHRELAVSYMERGFTQKAYFACEKAYELGCRDMDFVLMYASECYDYSEYKTGMQILLEIIRQDKKWNRDELPEVFEAYLMLFKISQESYTTIPELLDSLLSFLEQYRLYIPEYIMEVSIALSYICSGYHTDMENLQKVGQIFDILDKACHTEEEKEIIRHFRQEYNFTRLINDSRISDTMSRAYDAFYGIEGLHPIILKFALLDTKLCMIEEREEILDQAENIIKKEYPDFYGKMEEFLEKLKTEKNLSYLKESLKKSYQRVEPDCSGGFYYKKYPQEKPKKTVIHDGTEFEPYVRDTKKIGRNDPCPCGSGKKYKQCCMNKKN